MNVNQHYSEYGKFMKPKLYEMLRALGLDYKINSASGSTVFVKVKETEVEVLDFICGYGSCLLGHNHPKLKKTIIKDLENDMPFHSQLTEREEAGKLAKMLNKLAFKETGKKFKVHLANTGAGAVESAIKHLLLNYDIKKQEFIKQGLASFNREVQLKANSERDLLYTIRELWLQKVNLIFKNHKPLFIALHGSYHGQTLGALSLTANNHYRSAIENSLLDCYFIDPEYLDRGELQEKIYLKLPIPFYTANGEYQEYDTNWNIAAGIFAEPILGEGGVFPLSTLAHKNLKCLSVEFKIPLVWDEIQTGCFRTGHLFASSMQQEIGDYYLLGKSLGGGMAKISALMIEENQYIREFDVLHTSTFAEDDLSSRVACKFLSIAITQKEKIARISHGLYKNLQVIANRYNTVIKEVRNKGLLVGIEFRDMNLCGSYGFQGISRSGFFNYVIAAWFYKHHKIRVSAPLSNEFTVRLHIPVVVKPKELNTFYNALIHLCDVISKQDLYAFIDFILPEKWQNLRKIPQNFFQPDVPFADITYDIPKAGFITHYIDPNGVYASDPALKVLPEEGIEFLMNRIVDFMPLVVITGSKIITTDAGPILLIMVGTSITSTMAKQALNCRELNTLRKVLQQAVILLETEGANIIGLGQYCSILTQNGKFLQTDRAQITTGNSYTTCLATNLVLQQMHDNLSSTDQVRSLAIVGGKGNIGTAMVEKLKQRFDEIILFVNPNSKSIERVEQVSIGSSIKISRDLNQLKYYQVVLIATNQSESFIGLSHLHDNAIICDVSVPSALVKEVSDNPGNRTIFFGGLASLPGSIVLPAKGFPLPPGEIYGCLAETLILALHRRPDLASLGKVDIKKIDELKELGDAAGIRLINSKIVNIV